MNDQMYMSLFYIYFVERLEGSFHLSSEDLSKRLKCSQILMMMAKKLNLPDLVHILTQGFGILRMKYSDVAPDGISPCD